VSKPQACGSDVSWETLHARPLTPQVSEGLDVLAAINEAFVDDAGVPIQNIRVRHTIVLEDPFPDPPALAEHVPEKSPEPAFAPVRLGCCARILASFWF